MSNLSPKETTTNLNETSHLFQTEPERSNPFLVLFSLKAS